MAQFFPVQFLNPFFYYDISKKGYIVPDLFLESVSEIDTAYLDSHSIEAVLFDCDNTLCPHHGIRIPAFIEPKFCEIGRDYRVAIITNNTNTSRRERLKAALEESYPALEIYLTQSPRKKPAPEPYLEALDALAASPETSVMVGDNALTDTAGAKMLGIRAILVKPVDLSSEPFCFRIARRIESYLLSKSGVTPFQKAL